MIVELNACTHHRERIFIRYPLPVTRGDGPLVGLALQHDFDGVTEACVVVLSRHEMTDEEFRILASSRSTVPQDRLGLKC